MSDPFQQLRKPLGGMLGRLRSPFGDRRTRDARKFKKQRAEFYHDLAENMENQPRVNITVHIERQVDRYPTEAKGRLAAYWLEKYRLEGSFAESIRDTVPKEDYAPLMIAEQAGDLKSGLRDLSSVVAALDATKEAISVIWYTTLFSFLILQVFIGFYSFAIVPKIEDNLPNNVPIASLGTVALMLHWMSVLVRTLWPVWLAGIVALVIALRWSVPNYVGPRRAWLDRHVLHFKLYAEFQAASFIVALSAVTKRVNNKVISVPKALHLMEPNATVWLRLHIRRLIENLEDNPHGKGENFRTGMVGTETEYRMMDIADYADVSTMLSTVGAGILKRAPKEMERRAERIQLTSRLVLVAIVFAIQFGFDWMGWQFQDAVSMNAYSVAPVQPVSR